MLRAQEADMARWINDWNPEDEAFWERSGKRIARRNLFWSILAENIESSFAKLGTHRRELSFAAISVGPLSAPNAK